MLFFGREDKPKTKENQGIDNLWSEEVNKNLS